MSNRIRTGLGFTLIALASLAACSQDRTVPAAAPIPRAIQNPLAWSQAHWRDLGFCGVVEQCHVDIDHDGVAEWFIAPSENRGNAGNSFLVFKKVGVDYITLGEIFLHPAAVHVLPLSERGEAQLITYWRSSGSEGSLHWWTYRDGAFVTTRTEVIHPGDGGTDEGRRRCRELFDN